MSLWYTVIEMSLSDKDSIKSLKILKENSYVTSIKRWTLKMIFQNKKEPFISHFFDIFLRLTEFGPILLYVTTLPSAGLDLFLLLMHFHRRHSAKSSPLF